MAGTDDFNKKIAIYFSNTSLPNSPNKNSKKQRSSHISMSIDPDDSQIAGSQLGMDEWQNRRRKTTSERDRLFNDFLKTYTNSLKNKAEQKQKLKLAFFIVVVSILVLTMFTPVAFMVFAFINSTIFSSVGFVASILGAFADLLVGFIVLPKIIAKYLFDKREDQNLVEIISKMQDYNLKQTEQSQVLTSEDGVQE